VGKQRGRPMLWTAPLLAPLPCPRRAVRGPAAPGHAKPDRAMPSRTVPCRAEPRVYALRTTNSNIPKGPGVPAPGRQAPSPTYWPARGPMPCRTSCDHARLAPSNSAHSSVADFVAPAGRSRLDRCSKKAHGQCCGNVALLKHSVSQQRLMSRYKSRHRPDRLRDTERWRAAAPISCLVGEAQSRKMPLP
jgi:hypothetical protein